MTPTWSGCVVPLIAHDRTLGSVSLVSVKKSAFGGHDVGLLEECMGQIAIAVESVDQQELDHELRSHGIDVEEIRPLIPILEDAFVELRQRRRANGRRIMTNPIQDFAAIFYKEVRHMRRDPMAILFALVLPVLQIIILGSNRHQHPPGTSRGVRRQQ